MRMRQCPTCHGNIMVYYDHEPGDEVYCQDCGREFTLRSLYPINLEPLDPYDLAAFVSDDDQDCYEYS